ncbi:MFS transporter [TM7 phylum sp. oral taxon 351]|nr:MFS transporter [TM7 phylum sp. oral taxon 351]
MPKQRNNKHKKSILELITAVVLSSLLTLSPLFSLVSQKNDVYADGFSNADIILLEAIKNGLKKCIDNGFLKKTEIPNSNDLKAEKLYNNTGDVRKENFVALPYRYGTGNTLSDGGVSCEELFEGFSGGASNSFNTYLQLGGSGAPTITNGTDPTERKNAFLEALGYSSDESGNKQATCGKLVYSVVKGTISTANFTNTICVSTDAEGNIVSSRGAGKNLNEDDFTDKGGASNQNLTLKYEDGAITLKVDTSKDVGNCTLGPAKVYSSQKIKNGNSRTNAKDLFNNFFDSIPANSLSDAHSEVIGSSNDFDVNGAPAVHGGCVPKTLKKELKADSVLVRTSESKSSVSAENTSTNSDLNAAMGKHYKYTGSPDYDKLMKILVPNYSAPDDNTTALASAYNWFYLLNDVFNGISVDNSIKCNKTQPSNGIYLKYYNRSDDDPEKFEEEYCALDEAALNQKNTTVIMSDGEAGKVNGALRSSSGVMIGLLTARDVLDNLNRLDLPSLCAQDGSFPLCRANPSECQEDPTKEDCRNANNASETEEDGQNGEQAACMQNAGALGWIICPLMYGVRDAANGIFQNAVSPLLRVHESILTGLSSSSNSPMYQAWSFFRNVANIMFVIAMLFVIFSQITGFGIDNYGIKKILPKLIVTAIIVNFSYIICGIFVDLSNIIGEGIKNILESVAGSTTTATEKLGDNVVGVINTLIGALAAVGAAAGGLTIAGAAISNAVVSGSLLTVIFPILAFVGSALMAGFFAMLMLGLRQALIIIMIVISPVAFVLYAIPNTNGLFKKWFQLFKTLLMLFPVFCFMVGGGFLVSNIIIKGSKDFFMTIIGGLISIAPYFAVPSMTKNAMKGFDGAVAGLGTLQQKANNAGTSINKKITNSDTMKDSMQNAQIGKMQRYVDKYKGTDVSKLQPWQRRRLSNAIGFLNKDGRKTAAIGAAVKEYEYNHSQENIDRINTAEMQALDDSIKKDQVSSFRQANLSVDSAVDQLDAARRFNYTNASEEEKRNNDNRISALTSYLASTKNGQKAINEYMASNEHNGQPIISSTRADAAMGRELVNNHGDLRDKYQIMLNQADRMQGSGTLSSMENKAVSNVEIAQGRAEAVNHTAEHIDLNDLSKLGDNDARELEQVSNSANLQKVADMAIQDVTADPAKISSYSDRMRNLINRQNSTNTDINTLANSDMMFVDGSGNMVYKVVRGGNAQNNQQNP